MKFCKDCKYVRPDGSGQISANARCAKTALEAFDYINGLHQQGFAEVTRINVNKCGHAGKWFEPRENPARTDAGIGNDRGESLDASDIRPPLDPESPLYRRLVMQEQRMGTTYHCYAARRTK